MRQIERKRKKEREREREREREKERERDYVRKREREKKDILREKLRKNDSERVVLYRRLCHAFMHVYVHSCA